MATNTLEDAARHPSRADLTPALRTLLETAESLQESWILQPAKSLLPVSPLFTFPAKESLALLQIWNAPEGTLKVPEGALDESGQWIDFSSWNQPAFVGLLESAYPDLKIRNLQSQDLPFIDPVIAYKAALHSTRREFTGNMRTAQRKKLGEVRQRLYLVAQNHFERVRPAIEAQLQRASAIIKPAETKSETTNKRGNSWL